LANTFNCPSCSAPLVTDGLDASIHCEYCGATVIVPPELLKSAQSAGGGVPSLEPHPSQVDGPHGKLTPSQMRQMMVYIRSGQLMNASNTFQDGTGVSPEMAGQTVKMIADQIAATNVILPTELAAIMRTFAESAGRGSQAMPRAAEPRRRGSGVGCWLVLVIILVALYLSYTSISPVSLASSLIAGNTSAPVMQTAVAPFHAIATSIASFLH
jgi:hypothetical protein